MSAQIGLSVRLPHSLYQTSSLIRRDTVTSRPAARSTPARALEPGSRRPVELPDDQPVPAAPVTPRPARATTRTGARSRRSPARREARTRSRRRGRRCPGGGRPPGRRTRRGTTTAPRSAWTAPRSTGPSSGPTDAATAGIDCALTETITKSCGPSSAASSEAATRAVSVPSADGHAQAAFPDGASVAPRASTDTSASSTAASLAAMTPPIAPAPTTQMRMPHVYRLRHDVRKSTHDHSQGLRHRG